MNQQDVNMIAEALARVRPRFPPQDRIDRAAFSAWGRCVAAISEGIAGHVTGFDRAAFVTACGVEVTIFREH